MATESRLLRLRLVGNTRLFEDKALITVGMHFLVIRIRFQHFFGDVTHAPIPIANAPTIHLDYRICRWLYRR